MDAASITLTCALLILLSFVGGCVLGYHYGRTGLPK